MYIRRRAHGACIKLFGFLDKRLDLSVTLFLRAFVVVVKSFCVFVKKKKKKKKILFKRTMMETLQTSSSGLQTTTTTLARGKACRPKLRSLQHHRRGRLQQQPKIVHIVKAGNDNSSSSSSSHTEGEKEGGEEQDAFAETRRENADSASTSEIEEEEEESTENTNNKKKLWECSQCFGNQSVLVSQLRDVSEVLADGFGKPADDLLNGLMQKTRWSAGNFACVIARPRGSQPYKPSKRLTTKSVRRKGATAAVAQASSANKDKKMFRDGNDIVGACDLTLLPAFGPKASRESRVKNGVKLLRLSNESNFLYLTGMTTRSANRRMGVGEALLEECDVIAQKMEKIRPKCIALHVAKNNANAIGLYESCGYRIVSESTMTTTTTTTSNDGSGGERSSTGSSGSSAKNDESGVPPTTSPSSLGDKFMQFANKMGSVPKFGGGGNGGGGGGEEEVHFMVKWIRRDVIDEKVKRMDETGVLKEIPTL